MNSFLNKKAKAMNRSTNRFTVGFLALAGTIVGIYSAALSADLPQRAPVYTKAPVMVPPFSWTGFYVGVNIGGAWGTSSDTNASFALPTTGNFHTSGVLGGGQLGYNWQYGQWVLGLETDIDGSGLKGSTSSGICLTVVCTTSQTWLGTTRGRVGYAFDHWLVYGTGGVAYGDVKFTDLPAPVVVSGTDTKLGWTGGGGVEYAFAMNWSAKLEYLYVDLGNAGIACTPGCGTSNIKFNENILRGGLNYHF
jgi:outer membrane immunogenic protein